MDSELEALPSAEMLKGIHHRAQDDTAKTSDTGKSFPKELRLGLAVWLSLPCVSPLQKLLSVMYLRTLLAFAVNAYLDLKNSVGSFF